MIHINLWDDYYDDGHVPSGEKQETHMYVEESKFPVEKEKAVLDIVLKYLKKNLPKSIELNLKLYNALEKYPNLKDSGMKF